jgi:hypothetical protein
MCPIRNSNARFVKYSMTHLFNEALRIYAGTFGACMMSIAEGPDWRDFGDCPCSSEIYSGLTLEPAG